MAKLLDDSEFEVVAEALKHYKMHVENYDGYPSYEFKRQQLQRVESAMSKVKALRIETATPSDSA